MDYYGEHGGFSGARCMLSTLAIHLRDSFRLLWEQHVYWTRMVILGISFTMPDLGATTNRLLRNASDFAKLFCRFYGKEIAAEFNTLMNDHITIAAELVAALKAGNCAAAADAEKRWYANADEIACFLNHINPCWPTKPMQAMWYEHLALTKQEAVATLNKNYTKSIETFNRIEQQALLMADDFANGIIRQFNL